MKSTEQTLERIARGEPCDITECDECSFFSSVHKEYTSIDDGKIKSTCCCLIAECQSTMNNSFIMDFCKKKLVQQKIQNLVDIL